MKIIENKATKKKLINKQIKQNERENKFKENEIKRVKNEIRKEIIE